MDIYGGKLQPFISSGHLWWCLFSGIELYKINFYNFVFFFN
jgi:hypothetical protein